MVTVAQDASGSQGHNNNLVLGVAYLNVTLYALCYQMQSPVLPYLVEKLGDDLATEYAKMQVLFGVVQLCGGLVAGPLSDSLGAKVLLLLSFGASALCYGLTAVSTSMAGLYLSRVPTLLQHAVLAARAMVADYTDHKTRATKLGYIGLAYGLGFAVGPWFGGFVAEQFSLETAAWLACAGSMVSVGLVVILLPGGRPSQQGTKDGEKKQLSWKVFVDVTKHRHVFSLLVVKFIASVPSAMMRSIFALIAIEHFRMTPSTQGNVLSFMGIVVAVCQGTLIGWATSRFSETSIIKSSVVLLLLSFLAFTYISTPEALCAVIVPMMAGGTLLQNVNTAQLTKAVPSEDSGTIIAIDMAIGSGIGIFTPALGTFLFERGFSTIGFSCSATYCLLLLLLQLGVVHSKVH